MRASRVTVRNGRIELDAPGELPDGTEVFVDVTPVPAGKIGLTESEWRDDPAALADWSAWLETIEPVQFAEEDRRSRRDVTEMTDHQAADESTDKVTHAGRRPQDYRRHDQ
jgi:hypothetical protein